MTELRAKPPRLLASLTPDEEIFGRGWRRHRFRCRSCGSCWEQIVYRGGPLMDLCGSCHEAAGAYPRT